MATNLLRSWRRMRVPERLLVVGPQNMGYEDECGANAEWYPLRGVLDRGWGRPIVDNVVLPRLVSEWRADVVLSLSNMACRVPKGTHAEQILLIMWPYIMYTDEEIWKRLSMRERIAKQIRRGYIRATSQRANLVVAQTEVAKRRLQDALSIRRIEVLPTAASLKPPDGGGDERVSVPRRPGWLCLSRYYPHKNLEVLLDAGALLGEAGSSASIWLTVGEDQGKGARRLLASIDERQLSENVKNLGPIPFEAVPSVYAAARGVILPTLLESFSQVFTEAMTLGVPLIAPDRDFAHAACGDGALYVDPLDPKAIAEAICRLDQDGEERRRLTALGLQRASSHPSWNEIGARYMGLCRKVAAEGKQ